MGVILEITVSYAHLQNQTKFHSKDSFIDHFIPIHGDVLVPLCGEVVVSMRFLHDDAGHHWRCSYRKTNHTHTHMKYIYN